MKVSLYPSLAKKVSRLQRREQVLLGIWAGQGMKEIATELGLSPKTVEFHRAKLYRVFGVDNPVALCRRAMAAGLIKADETQTRKRRKRGKPLIPANQR